MPADLNADAVFMHRAARLAMRGHGGAEPNPLVGCLIVDADGVAVLGWGYHRRFGGPHAEIMALRRAGERARRATAFITLEPCNHIGKTGPCTDALIDAGVGRVVVGRRDPNPSAGGGIERLRGAGLDVCVLQTAAQAVAITDPFVHRVQTGLPWVVAKWAQTLDGHLTTPPGMGRWISGDRSRRMVHRERGRVDAVLTGIGTVRADDPLLTARGVRIRRVARRVVVDPELSITDDRRLLRTLDEAPLTIACDVQRASTSRADELTRRGVEIIGVDNRDSGLRLESLLRALVERHGAATVLVEAGPRLLRSLRSQRLVNEAWVFIGPMLLDAESPEVFEGNPEAPLPGMSLTDVRRRGPDVMLRYSLDPGSP